MLVAARPELANLSQVADVLPGVGTFVLFVGFFLFGYFMYSGLYAAVGAMCNTDEEAQQAQIPLIFLLVTPVLLVMNVIQDPLSPMSTALSLFPLFTPILMWGRVATGVVPVWEVALSFALMLLAIFAIAWLAGRIYKVGILMAGKRPTLPELWRWVREA
jgi:ABC-2 type transport system permease protein